MIKLQKAVTSALLALPLLLVSTLALYLLTLVNKAATLKDAVSRGVHGKVLRTHRGRRQEVNPANNN